MYRFDIVQVFWLIASFLLGSVVGSFLNVCIYRLPRGESLVFPGSRCPKCGANIRWFDNIPIISWIILRGKCRSCHQPISWQYPLVEGVTAILFLLIFLRFGFAWGTPIYMLFAAALVLVTFVDLAHWIIPDEITIPGIPFALLVAVFATWYPESGLRILGSTNPVFDAFIGIEVGGLLFLLDKLSRLLLNKPGMGMGDVKLLAMIGGFLGWAGALLTILLAAISGSVIGLILIVIAKRKQYEPDTHAGSSERVPLGGWLGAPGTILLTSTFLFFQMLTQSRDKQSPPESDDSDEDAPELTIAKHYLPFGPYLCLGGLIVMFYGKEIIDFYLHSIRI